MINNEVNEKVLDYLKNDNLRYDEKEDKIFIKNIEADEYDIRVICAKIKEHLGIIIDEQRLKDILINVPVEAEIIETETSIIKELDDIIDKDDSIEKSEWEKFKLWKNTEALWKINKDGEKTSLIECQKNIEGFIENFPKYKGKIYHETTRDYIEIDGLQLTDKEIFMIMGDLTKYMLPTCSSPSLVRNAINSVAFKNTRNRIKEWMEDNYENYYDDSKDYIEYILTDVFRCEDLDKFHDLYYEELKIHLMSSIKKLCYVKKEADFKYDNILVLCSVQGGTGKTTFPEFLYTFDDICYTNIWDPESINFTNKDFLEQLHNSACNVFDEVSVKRCIFNAVKSFISKKNEQYRKSYGFLASKHNRKFVLWGTSNNNDFLKDYTAELERRWMIIHVSEDKMNGVYLNNMMRKDNYLLVRRIWAQVMKLYKENPNFDMYLSHDWDDVLTKLQREYKSTNNESYNTIIDDFLEREYGFYDEFDVDVESIVAQYRYGNSKEWCEKHNEEIEIKESKARRDEYVMKPEDRYIKWYGKIDRIRKTTLHEILDKLKFEYTKTSLRAEMKTSGRWNGCEGNQICKIGKISYNAYWRKEKEQRIVCPKNDNGHLCIPF